MKPTLERCLGDDDCYRSQSRSREYTPRWLVFPTRVYLVEAELEEGADHHLQYFPVPHLIRRNAVQVGRTYRLITRLTGG